MKSPLRRQTLYINHESIISPKSPNNKEGSVHRWWVHRSLKFKSLLKKENSVPKYWENSVIVYHHYNKEIIFKMEEVTPFASLWKSVTNTVTCISRHTYSKDYPACSERLPETPQFYWLHFCVQMCPFYPGLTPGTWCPHCIAAPLPLSHYPSLLILYPCPNALCSQLFCKWSWLHHVAAFMWSETLPAALAQGRVTLRALAGLSALTHCSSVRCTKTGTSAESSSWMGHGGRRGLRTMFI